MGNHQASASGATELRTFMQSVLEDIRALERMIDEGMIERDVRRIGAEQELFLVDEAWRPLPIQAAMLERLGQSSSSFTPELASFNIEANLQPQVLSPTCLTDMHEELDDLMRRARGAAQAEGGQVLNCGIPPTLAQSDLSLTNWPRAPVTGSSTRSCRICGEGASRASSRGSTSSASCTTT